MKLTIIDMSDICALSWAKTEDNVLLTCTRDKPVKVSPPHPAPPFSEKNNKNKNEKQLINPINRFGTRRNLLQNFYTMCR